MGFLEKFAKLTTDIKNYGGGGTNINVYDDELDTKKPVMWLTCFKASVGELIDEGYLNKNKENYKDEEALYVPVIDFNNDLFFKMPENRQNSAATVLLKNFIKYYKNNFDGVPVSAAFENYDLQEKFKAAIDKGIFPKISKELTDFTNIEEYEKDSLYNMNNRKLTKNIKNEPEKFFNNATIKDGVFINYPISEMLNKFKENNINFVNEIKGKFENGDVLITIPFISDIVSNNTSFSININDIGTIIFQHDPLKDDSELEEIINAKNNFSAVLDLVETFSSLDNKNRISIDELFKTHQIKSKINKSRLKKLNN